MVRVTYCTPKAKFVNDFHVMNEKRSSCIRACVKLRTIRRKKAGRDGLVSPRICGGVAGAAFALASVHRAFTRGCPSLRRECAVMTTADSLSVEGRLGSARAPGLRLCCRSSTFKSMPASSGAYARGKLERFSVARASASSERVAPLVPTTAEETRLAISRDSRIVKP